MQADENRMPHREKTAWLSLIAMALTYGPYFAIVASGIVPETGLPNFRLLGLFGLTAIVQLIILGAGHFYLDRVNPQEARMRPDERDLAIKRYAVSSAYGVLIFGMILVGCIMPFYAAGWKIVNTALFMIVLAEVVHYAVIATCYRMQA